MSIKKIHDYSIEEVRNMPKLKVKDKVFEYGKKIYISVISYIR